MGKTSDPKGAKYDGCVNRTVSGRECQPWASTTPHNHGFTKSLGGEGNNCRNPDGGPSPWCYTADPNKRWELCEDLTCGKSAAQDKCHYSNWTSCSYFCGDEKEEFSYRALLDDSP